MVFNVSCEDEDGLALYINGDYMRDVEELPSREELIDLIEQDILLKELSEEI